MVLSAGRTLVLSFLIRRPHRSHSHREASALLTPRTRSTNSTTPIPQTHAALVTGLSEAIVYRFNLAVLQATRHTPKGRRRSER